MKRILVVEDDITMNKMIANLIREEADETNSAHTLEEANEALHINKYDLVILDVNLPDGTGYEICKYIKKDIKNTAVIFLTANDLEEHMIKGYELGASDYITKPFSNAVLRCKVKAILSLLKEHQNKEIGHKIFDDGNLYINFSSLSAKIQGNSISLAPMEYRVLEVFVENKGILLTRQKLFEKLWDNEENYIEEHTLTATISRIRGKIEKGGQKYIQTVYGMGYMFTERGGE